jgi:hypothetical protein
MEKLEHFIRYVIIVGNFVNLLGEIIVLDNVIF